MYPTNPFSEVCQVSLALGWAQRERQIPARQGRKEAEERLPFSVS